MNIRTNSVYSKRDARQLDFLKTHYEACIFLASDLSSITLGTQFRKCQFGTSRLVRTRFHKAKFVKCSFRNADMSEAVFDDSTFIDCDFTGALLRRAVGLRGSHFLHCKGLDTVKGAKFKYLEEHGAWKIDDNWSVRASNKNRPVDAPKTLGPAPKSEKGEGQGGRGKSKRALPVIDKGPKNSYNYGHCSEWDGFEDYWDQAVGVHRGGHGGVRNYNYNRTVTPMRKKKATLFCSNPDEYEGYER